MPYVTGSSWEVVYFEVSLGKACEGRRCDSVVHAASMLWTGICGRQKRDSVECGTHLAVEE